MCDGAEIWPAIPNRRANGEGGAFLLLCAINTEKCLSLCGSCCVLCYDTKEQDNLPGKGLHLWIRIELSTAEFQNQLL